MPQGGTWRCLGESKTLAWGFAMAPHRLRAPVTFYIINQICHTILHLDPLNTLLKCFNYTPANFVGGILFSRCPSVRASVRPSVTLCFLNNWKSHCWIFIKPSKHVHICMTNTVDKKVRARGQFY